MWYQYSPEIFFSKPLSDVIFKKSEKIASEFIKNKHSVQNSKIFTIFS